MTAHPPSVDLNSILQWDVENWSQALQYWETHVPWDEVDSCLEVGANRGGLSLWLASKGKSVVCSDRSEVELFKVARGRHSNYGLEDLIRYQSIDATDIPYENEFDLVIFKSVLGHVGKPDRKDLQALAIQQMHKALKPGGRLLFAENAFGSPLHRAARRLFVDWGDQWRYVSLAEMLEFLEVFSSFKLRTAGFFGVFGRSQRQRHLLSSVDRLIEHLTPARWNYILFGIAQK